MTDGRANIERMLKLARGDKTPDRPPDADDPTATDRLPNAENVTVDRRKFVDYSMDPDNPRNNGKWKAWETVGYDVHHHHHHHRRDDAAAAADAMGQLRERLPEAETHSVDHDDPRASAHRR